MSYQWVRASEIAEYMYCNRAWYLRRIHGVKSANVQRLEDGRFHHKKHGRSLQNAIWLQRFAYLLLFITIAAITFQLVAGRGG